MMSKRTTPRRGFTSDGKVLIIVDSADASRDYYLPAERAERLFDVGRLCMVQVYGGRWDLATADGHIVL